MTLGTIKMTEQDWGIAVGPELPLESADAVVAWRGMWVEILTYVYLARPVYLITVDPQPWSLMREFCDAPTKEIGNHRYLIVFKDHCSERLLRNVAESEDFWRGLLYFSSKYSDELANIYSLAPISTAMPPPLADCRDVLICVADGNLLWWVNPGRSISELTTFFIDLVSRFAFGFAAEGPGGARAVLPRNSS
jgi:hypothetical protein